MDTEETRWQGWTVGLRLLGRSECGSELHWPELKMHVGETDGHLSSREGLVNFRFPLSPVWGDVVWWGW